MCLKRYSLYVICVYYTHIISPIVVLPEITLSVQMRLFFVDRVRTHIFFGARIRRKIVLFWNPQRRSKAVVVVYMMYTNIIPTRIITFSAGEVMKARKSLRQKNLKFLYLGPSKAHRQIIEGNAISHHKQPICSCRIWIW